MGARQPKERRTIPRYHVLAKEFPCKLVVSSTGDELDAKVMDVGREGLGLLLETPIRKGEAIHLLLSARKISFQVVYCQKDLIHQGLYRCGLRRFGSNENLLSLLPTNGQVPEND